jgi:hypothetical protein
MCGCLPSSVWWEGGGVGFVLLQYVRLLDYQAAGIAVWFIAVTVAVLDYVSAEIRERMILGEVAHLRLYLKKKIKKPFPIF